VAIPPPFVITASPVLCHRFHWHNLPYPTNGDIPVRYTSQAVKPQCCQFTTFQTHYLYIYP